MSIEPEIKAMGECYQALNEINDDSRLRVIQWIISKFNFVTINKTNDKGKYITDPEISAHSNIPKGEKRKEKPPSKSPSSKKSLSESYSIDRNLNLRGDSDMPSFKDFYKEKKPSSKAEFNTAAVYYLKVLMKLENVSLDQVYTCYKEVSVKPPDHFKQSFRDTKSNQGYIEYDDLWSLSIPHRGKSFVEHDLPKKVKIKK